MWTQFFLENAHFSLNLFAALTCFAVAWLYFDAWKMSKRGVEVVRVFGFVLLSFAFIIHSIFLETSAFASSLLPNELYNWIQISVRLGGYFCIFASLIFEKLQSRPSETKPQEKTAAYLPFIVTPLAILHIFQPVLTFLIALFYFRRSTKGLERHVKPVAFAFFILTLSEIVSLSSLWRNTSNSSVYALVAPMGVLWMIEHLLLALAFIVLGRWVFGYLLKQFQTQLFMILSLLTLCIFLVTTIAFTSLLVSNIQTEELLELGSDAKVLEYALSVKREESISNAQFIAQNPDLANFLAEKNNSKLATISEQLLLSKNTSSLVFTDEDGVVVARGEDGEKVGNSLSGNTLVKRALIGETVSSITSKEGILAPELSLSAAAPIKKGEEVLGIVLIETKIDNAFVDGIKKATGLDASLFGDNIISATTLLSSDGKQRLSGMKEQNRKVTDSVLLRMKEYSGAVQVGNTPYFSVYVPIKDIDGSSLGMLSVGRPQTSVLATAAKSIELTFLVCAILLVISILPSFLIARYLSNQLN